MVLKIKVNQYWKLGLGRSLFVLVLVLGGAVFALVVVLVRMAVTEYEYEHRTSGVGEVPTGAFVNVLDLEKVGLGNFAVEPCR
jgi:hypothetical protein